MKERREGFHYTDKNGKWHYMGVMTWSEAKEFLKNINHLEVCTTDGLCVVT